jgi:hypothetical protein
MFAGLRLRKILRWFTGSLLLYLPLYAADMKAEKNPVLHISVLTSGKVLLDGKESNLSELKKALGKVRSEKAVVWYYRESGKGEPPQQAMEVIKLGYREQPTGQYVEQA